MNFIDVTVFQGKFGNFSAVPDTSVNEDMDYSLADSAWSHYEIDCALEEPENFYSSKKEMAKVNKVRLSFCKYFVFQCQNYSLQCILGETFVCVC